MARTLARLPADVRITDYISLGVVAKWLLRVDVERALVATGWLSRRQRDFIRPCGRLLRDRFGVVHAGFLPRGAAVLVVQQDFWQMVGAHGFDVRVTGFVADRRSGYEAGSAARAVSISCSIFSMLK